MKSLKMHLLNTSTWLQDFMTIPLRTFFTCRSDSGSMGEQVGNNRPDLSPSRRSKVSHPGLTTNLFQQDGSQSDLLQQYKYIVLLSTHLFPGTALLREIFHLNLTSLINYMIIFTDERERERERERECKHFFRLNLEV